MAPTAQSRALASSPFGCQIEKQQQPTQSRLERMNQNYTFVFSSDRQKSNTVLGVPQSYDN